jgi:ABC-type cobalt transport system, ATPase component
MQNSDYQLFTESVEKELYLGNRIDDQYKKKGKELLRSMDLFQFIHRHPASLSGGQKQRLCIAVACMKDTEVVCFDEPTSGLDFENMKRVSKLLQKLADEGRTILVTSHDYEFLMATCSHICHLDNGNVKDYFTLSEQTAKKTYGILF